MKLGEYLRSCRKEKKLTLTKISKKATILKKRHIKKYKGFSVSQSFFSLVENNRIDLHSIELKSFLEYLATLYETSVIILLAYLPTQVSDIIHLAKSDNFQDPPFEDENMKGIGYKIGQYRLMDSFIAPVYFKIEKGQSTGKIHRHDGEELMIVIKNSIDVVFNDINVTKKLNEGDILHFKSNQNHYVINKYEQPAIVYVIRCMFDTNRDMDKQGRLELANLSPWAKKIISQLILRPTS